MHCYSRFPGKIHLRARTVHSCALHFTTFLGKRAALLPQLPSAMSQIRSSYGKFDNIQVLRGVAALAVVMCHAWQTNLQYTSGLSRVPHSLVEYLVSGVDLFFVISGFVILYTTQKSRLSAKDFAIRRAQRIVPMYWLLTIVFFAVLLFMPQLKSAQINNWTKFLASLTFTAGVFGLGNPVIYPGWTLEYEMGFYVLTTVTLLVLPKRPWPVVAIALTVLQMAHWVIPPALDSLSFEFATNRIILSFLGGIVVAQLALEGRPGIVEGGAFLIGLISAIVEDPTQRAVMYGLPSALVVYLAVKSRSTWGNRWFVKLGDASYAIYLVHVFLIALVGKVSRSISPTLDADLLATVMLLMPIAAGLLLHQWFELPVSAAFARRRQLHESKAALGTA